MNINCQIRLGALETALVIEHGLFDRFNTLLSLIPAYTAAQPVEIIADSAVTFPYAQRLKQSLAEAGRGTRIHSVPAGEESKSLSVLNDVYANFVEAAVGRDAIVVGLGGGAVGDFAGFVASTWMRGLPYVIAPTTVACAVDACLGGKTALNLPGGKNLIGTFHPAAAIAIDPEAFATLPSRDIRAGLAESIKHAAIHSTNWLAWHEAHADRILALDRSIIPNLVQRNLSIKSEIIGDDVFERAGRRIKLNFGHTIGHALEDASRFALRHGECVSLGMIAAMRISQRMELLDAAEAQRIERLLIRFGLPAALTMPIDADEILDRMRRDKKVASRTTRFVLLEGIGRPVVRSDVPIDLVREVIASLTAS